MPFTAALVSVPPRAAPEVPVPEVIVSVTLAVDDVMVLPDASWIVTWMAGVMTAPASALDGSTVNASLVATGGGGGGGGGAVIVKLVLVALVSPELVAVSV